MEITKRIRPQKKWLVWMGAVVVLTLVVWTVSIAFVGGPETDDHRGGGANINAIRPKADATVGGAPKTESYNTRVREQDDLLAEIAQKEGKSVVPTVMGEGKRPSNVTKVAPAPEPPPKIHGAKQPPPKSKPSPPPRSQKKPSESAQMKAYKAALQKDMQMILGTNMEYPPHKTVTFYQPDPAGDNNSDQTGKNNPTTKQPDDTGDKDSSSKQPLPFEPGDILYSSNVIALNSDVPSPVVVEIVSGAAKKSTFFGKFTRHGKHMLLRFDRVKDPYGTEHTIDAIALDMDTSSAAVRSRVDSHYFERWGGLVAASFLEGFGEAKAQSGQSFETSDTTDTFTYPEYDVEEQAWIAAGKVGTRLANIMEKNFGRPPTVYADHHDLFGIMILATER